jgi:nucleoside-diphosphate-sugar epimerase
MADFFLTGATGFMGRHLIKQLHDEGHDLYCLVRKKHPLTEKYQRINWIYGDLNNPGRYTRELKKADYVIHMAGIITTRSRDEYYRVNVEGTRKLLNACQENSRDLKRFLYMSSIAAVGAKSENSLLTEDDPPEPETEYGKSKLLAETETLKCVSEFPVVILRPTFIYGPGDTRGLKFLKLLSEQNELISFSIIETASLCYISDLVSACLLALTKPVSSGQIFHISDPKVYTWKQVNTILKQIVGELYPLTSDDNFIFKRMFNDSRDSHRKKLTDRPLRKYWGCSIDKACKLLGFEPKYTLLNGARETIRWYHDRSLYNSNLKYEHSRLKGRVER